MNDNGAPLLSLILPVYKAEAYLPRCLDSILDAGIDSRQLEIIAVDDASPDGSFAMLETYAASHPELRLLRHEQNAGIGATRNDGLRVARGRYVWFIDSDDALHTANLPRLLSLLQHSEAELIAFNFTVFRDQGPDERFPAFDLIPTPQPVSGRELFLTQRLYFAPWNKILRRDFLLRHDLFFIPGLYPEDVEWLTRCYHCAETARACDLDLYRWYIRSDSQSHNIDHLSTYINGFEQVIDRHLALISLQPDSSFWAKDMKYKLCCLYDFCRDARSFGVISPEVYRDHLTKLRRRARRVLSQLSPCLSRHYLGLIAVSLSPGIFRSLRDLADAIRFRR